MHYFGISKVFVGLAILIANTQSIDINPNFREDIDNYIRNIFLPENSNTSLAISITNNETTLYSTGYGLKDVENGIPATNETQYLIGSISKSFTALVVLKTLNEKLPDMDIETALNTPIRKLAPSFNFTLGDRFRSEQTTFRDMLSHRVCSLPNGFSTLTQPFQSSAEVGYRQRYAPEACGFRSSMVYNNGMYTLITETIEAVAGEPFGDLISRLFSDIGMESTTYVKKSDDDEIPSRAVAYYLKDGERHRTNPQLTKRVSISTGAGGVVSNALDMAKYVRFHLNKGKIDGRQVLPETLFNSMRKVATYLNLGFPQIYKPDMPNIRFGYCLGLMQGTLDGWERIGHSGSVPPYLTDMNFYPALNIGIYSSTNQMPLKIDHSALHLAIFNILLGQSVPSYKEVDANKDKKTSSEIKSERTLSSKSKSVKNDELIGSYGNGLQGELDITLKYWPDTNSTELYMIWGEWGKAYLQQTDTNLQYRVHWDSDIVQDTYAMGITPDVLLVFKEDGSAFDMVDTGVVSGTFQKGVYLGGLPPVPWNPDSCGPE